jgi:predicted dinucleotide-binding enzyme
MTTLPTIAVLGGTGKEGPGLAMRWAHAGYPIIIGSRQLEKAQRVAAEINEKLGLDKIATPITGLANADAARKAEISVLTVVATAHQPALESLKGDLDGKILVDATARVDFRDPRPPEGPSAARIAQDILGEDVLICADDVPAAEQVIHLAQAGGMKAYYAGGLDNAITVEGLTALLISINKHYGIKTASIGVTGVGE